MDTYAIGLQFWLSVAATGLLVPLLAVVARETVRTVECLRGSAADELPPHSHASAPSHPGL